MRHAFVVLAGLVLAQPTLAAYSPDFHDPQTTVPVVQSSPCTTFQTGFVQLRDQMAARQSNALLADVLKRTTSPAQLILAMGFLGKPVSVTDAILSTGHPAEMFTSLSLTFLRGVSEMDDQAGVALVLALADVKGVCARS